MAPDGVTRVAGVAPSAAAGGRLADLLALVEAVLPALQAGLAPGAALRLAADATANGRPSGPTAALAHHLAALSAEGLPIGPLWAQAATAWQSRELRLLAQAWSLTEDLGAPLAEAVLTTAGLLRARLRAERRVAGAVAGARATMNVLTALPLGGPFLALALGVSPSELTGRPRSPVGAWPREGCSSSPAAPGWPGWCGRGDPRAGAVMRFWLAVTVAAAWWLARAARARPRAAQATTWRRCCGSARARCLR